LGSKGTALEGLLAGRVEGVTDKGPQLRVKLGAGPGIDQWFGAPAWRIVFAIELFDHIADRDKDGIPDSKDACPDRPGVKSADATTNGCPPDPDKDRVPDAEDACPDRVGAGTADPRTNRCPAN
jgi:hypothetical protein